MTDTTTEVRTWPTRAPRWGDDEVGGLTTVQLHDGGLFDGEPHCETPIHLVRHRANQGGTPGPLLCGLDHHTLPIGFSVGGGISRPERGDADPYTAPCPTCVAVAARMMVAAGLLAVSGSVGGHRAKAAVMAELERMCALDVVLACTVERDGER